MRVAIVGSRDYPDPGVAVRNYIEAARDGGEFYGGTIIISGGARGIDTAAVEYADYLGLPTIVYPADWGRQGKAAGYARNEDIIADCDRVVAFWDGESKGTRHTIELALKNRKRLEVVFP